MSELLDNKSDTEIEEIYNRATLDDLQSMLIQEKSINRRRLLRKVMRIKQTDDLGYSKPAESVKENISKDNNLLRIIAATSIKNSDKPKRLTTEEENKLDKLKSELDNTVDLVKRKLLRKEIHDLEEQYSGQIKQMDNNIQIVPTQNSIVVNKREMNNDKPQNMSKSSFTVPKENDLINKEQNGPFVNISRNLPKNQLSTAENNKLKTSFGVSDEEILRNQGKSDNIKQSEKPKLDLIKTELMNNKYVFNSTEKILKPSSPTQLSQKEVDKTKIISDIPPTTSVRNISRVQSVRERFEIPKAESASNKTTLNSTPKTVKPLSPTQSSRTNVTPIKQFSDPPSTKPVPNISRVQSFKGKFEIPTSQRKPENQKQNSNEELYNLVHASLKSDVRPKQSSQKTNEAQNLVVSEPRIRKTSDKGLLRFKALNIRGNSKPVLKEVLLKWIQKNTTEYQNVQISNYSKCWADGLAFCALIHHFYPNSFDYNVLSSKNPLTNFKLAFETAKKYAGIEQLIDPEDMMALDTPDEKCVYTYVQFMYNALKKHPRNMCRRSANLSSEK